MIHLATSLARHLPGLTETRSDAELLASFRSDRDEVAFAELVRRHGPLVWSACRRLLPDPADAEDAFQATFLVLVRRAHRLAGHPTLGPWLYQVAVWTARNMRRRNARILSRRLPQMPDVADPSPGPQAFDLRNDLDEALLALPEKYRSALVLCHLQGWSRREAAARLGCPEGTLSSLLSRGLDRLRVKLKGLDPTQALAIGVSSVPLVLATATVKAATGFHLAAACAATSTASLLAEGVLRMFWIKKATAASFALIAVFGMGMGIGVSVNQMPGAAAGEGETLVANGLVANGPDADTSVEDELFRRKLFLLKAKLAAAEKTVASALKGVELSKRKLEVSKEDFSNGTAKYADHLQDQITLTRFEENLAHAQRAVAQLELEIAELMATRKPTENRFEVIRLKNVQADEVMKVLHELFNGPKNDGSRVRLVAEKSSNSLIILKASPADLLTIRKLLEKVIDAEKDEDSTKLKPAGKELSKAGDTVDKHPMYAYLDIAIASKDETWAYSIREYGPGNKVEGTVYFENFEVLRRFLIRIGAERGGPKTVYLTGPANAKNETIQAILDVCKASGLHVLAQRYADRVNPLQPAGAGLHKPQEQTDRK